MQLNKLNIQTHQISFFIFGDSICYGQLVNAQDTWATALALAMNENPEITSHVLVQNAGINGNTTRQALERMHYDVTSHSPNFVMVQFGMNDCNYWATDRGLPRVSPKAFVANIEEIIERALVSGVQHCFLNTNHPSLKGEFTHLKGMTYEQSNAEYNTLIRDAYYNLVNNQRPVTLIDMEEEWKKQLLNNNKYSLDQLLQSDGIHLSDCGHNVYKNYLIPQVIESLTNIYMK